MWKPLGRTRLGLSLVLGVLAGVALLSLPALVSPTYQSPSSDSGDKAVNILSLANSFASDRVTGSSTTSSNSDRLALAINLSLILLPGSVLSILARRWAVRKLEEHWYY